MLCDVMLRRSTFSMLQELPPWETTAQLLLVGLMTVIDN